MSLIPLNIFRYAAIIRHIKRERYISMEKLVQEVANDMALSGFEGGFSKRTLERDLKNIRDNLDLTITFSKAEGGYYIPDDEIQDGLLESLLEHINLLSALRTVENVSDFVFAEKREAQGMEFVYPLVRAIKNRLIVEFNYRKYTGGNSAKRRVEPYALKEFNGRWYLLSNEPGTPDGVKTWGLDRIANLSVSDEHFRRTLDDNITREFRDCFGIYSDRNKPAEEVILSFSPLGGHYNASRPLHESQEVLIDNDREYRIRLKVKITWDFIIELLSQSDNMTVIAPQHLKDTLADVYRRALARTENPTVLIPCPSIPPQPF